MSDGLEITIEGMPEFDRSIVELSGPAGERIARKAMRAGGRIVQVAITAAAPVRPDLPSGTALPVGALKSDIELHVAKERDGSISAYVEPGKFTRHAARWAEYGHELVIKGKHVGHVPPHPFIRPSFEESQVAAQDAVAISIAEEFVKEATTLRYGN